MSDGWNEVSTFDALCMVLFGVCTCGLLYLIAEFVL
jgi:hypothetical protein